MRFAVAFTIMALATSVIYAQDWENWFSEPEQETDFCISEEVVNVRIVIAETLPGEKWNDTGVTKYTVWEVNFPAGLVPLVGDSVSSNILIGPTVMITGREFNLSSCNILLSATKVRDPLDPWRMLHSVP